MHAPPDALTRLDARLAALPKSAAAGDAVKGEAASMVTWLKTQEKVDPASLFQRGGKFWTMAGGERADPQVIAALQDRWSNPHTRAADLAAIGTLSEQA